MVTFLNYIGSEGMVAETIESMIDAMERKGWFMGSLSAVKGHGYSCLLERKKKGENGFAIYAASRLVPTAVEAVTEAWANAQKPIDNPRVFLKGGEVNATVPLGYRIKLEDAITAQIKVRTGLEAADDD